MTSTNLTGMDRNTGKWLTGLDHIAQSVGDILSTPLGTRVMRRNYGALNMQLADAPLNRATALLLMSASVMAVTLWEPRIMITSVALSGDFASGQAVASVTGVPTDQTTPNALTTLSIPITVPAI